MPTIGYFECFLFCFISLNHANLAHQSLLNDTLLKSVLCLRGDLLSWFVGLVALILVLVLHNTMVASGPVADLCGENQPLSYIHKPFIHGCNLDARAHAILTQFKVGQNSQEYPTLKTHPTPVTICHEEMNHRKTPSFNRVDWESDAAMHSLTEMGLESDLEKTDLWHEDSRDRIRGMWVIGFRRQICLKWGYE